MSWILTASARRFDYLAPDPEAISIIDIATHLAREPRYGGATKRAYNVAQHSWFVSQIVPRGFELEGLLHDAEEYVGKDIMSPLKALLPDYKALMKPIDQTIRAKFGLPPDMSPCVHKADLIMLATERRDLVPEHAEPWSCLEGIRPLERPIQVWSEQRSRMMFLERFIELTNWRAA